MCNCVGLLRWGTTPLSHPVVSFAITSRWRMYVEFWPNQAKHFYALNYTSSVYLSNCLKVLCETRHWCTTRIWNSNVIRNYKGHFIIHLVVFCFFFSKQYPFDNIWSKSCAGTILWNVWFPDPTHKLSLSECFNLLWSVAALEDVTCWLIVREPWTQNCFNPYEVCVCQMTLLRWLTHDLSRAETGNV